MTGGRGRRASTTRSWGKAEEYAIHDFEGFDGYRLGEYEGLESAQEIACFIEENPELGGAPLDHFNDLEQARKADARVRTHDDQPGANTLCCQLIETVVVLRFCPNPSIRIHGFTDLWGSGFTLLRIYRNPSMRFSDFV
ncbi:antirestriction protein ArdA [Pseudomonas sp.]|uniref:antirestriction protein ArdA n=1 Tax=Pseudomonas sp. TaxID=306 RepID=UPI003A985CCE